MIPRLASDTNEVKHEISDMKKQLNKYASAGLRTLILAWREVSQSEFTQWESGY